jgi:hypothetical protein
VWSWPPGAEVKSMMLSTSTWATGAIKPVPGEITYKPVNYRAGKAGCSARTCGSAACVFAARGPWVRSAPGLPCSLSIFRRAMSRQSSGASCRENAKACRVV